MKRRVLLQKNKKGSDFLEKRPRKALCRHGNDKIWFRFPFEKSKEASKKGNIRRNWNPFRFPKWKNFWRFELNRKKTIFRWGEIRASYMKKKRWKWRKKIKFFRKLTKRTETEGEPFHRRKTTIELLVLNEKYSNKKKNLIFGPNVLELGNYKDRFNYDNYNGNNYNCNNYKDMCPYVLFSWKW